MTTVHLRQIADTLAASGAVMTVWNSPATQYLVGDLQWIEGDRIFWFAAHGDSTADGHVLRFETAELAEGSVRFLDRGKTVALLSAIERADVDDRDDYRVAWSIWQQVAPVRRSLMAEARAACETV
jgi:hypothetical protein